MAGETDDIVQNIVLTGNDEVNEAFRRMQEAGEKAFESIRESLERAGEGFSAITLAAGGVAAAVGIVSVGMFELVKSSEEVVSTLSDLADQTGTTTQEISGLRAAFAAGGIGAGEMASAFRRLSVIVQSSWNDIRKASQESADNLRGDSLTVIDATLKQADAIQKLANVTRDQGLQAQSNRQSVADAQQKLDELNVQRLKQAGVDTSGLETQLAIQKELNEEAAAELALKQAKKKAADDAANAERDAQRAAVEAEQAQLAVNQARRKELEDQRNDINNVIAAVKKVAEGDGDALKSINATAENVVRGIIGATGESSRALQGLKGDIIDLASPAPEVKEVFNTIGQVLANIQDPALKTAVAFRLLGRTVTQEFINVISNPEKLAEFQRRIHDLGLEIDGADKKISENFREALFTLQNDVQLVAVKISSAFGPAFTALLSGIDNAIVHSKSSFEDFARAVADSVTPALESFNRVMAGTPEAAKDDWLVEFIAKLREFSTAVGDLATVFGKTFGGMYQAAQAVLDVFNRLVGTDLTPLTLPLKLIETTLGAISHVVESVAGGLNDLLDIFQGKGGQLFQIALEGIEAKLRAIAEILSGDIKKGMADWSHAVDEQNAKMRALDEQGKTAADNQKKQTDESKAEHKSVSEARAADAKEEAARTTSASQDSADAQVQHARTVQQARQQAGIATGEAATTARSSQQTAASGTGVGTAPRGTQSTDGSKLLESGGVVVLPGPGGSVTQPQINDALSKQRELPLIPMEQTKEGFQAELDDSIERLKRDFQSQREFNENIARQNGGLQRSGRLQDGYSPPVLGHYDPRTGGFVPAVPNNDFAFEPAFRGNFGPPKPDSFPDSVIRPPASTRARGFNQDDFEPHFPKSRPATADYDFAGRRNPAGPFQPGISTPLTFPDYNRRLMESLPSAFPGGVPLPQPRPDFEGEADALRQAVSQGMQDAQRQQPISPEATTPPPVPGTIPPPVEQAPLSPDLQPPTIGDVFRNAIQTLGDDLKSLFDQSVFGSGGSSQSSTPGQQSDSGIDDAFQKSASDIKSGGDDAAGSLSNAGDAIASAAQDAVDKLSNISSPSIAPVAAAGGGLILGGGSETSDSIDARLSRNEFVQPARATRHYGVNFMEAVRTLRLPRFAEGGLVSGFVPRFADGGHVSFASSSVHADRLGVVDLHTHVGTVRTMMTRDAYQSLQRRAVAARMTSSSTSGSKPGFVG